MQYLKNYGFNFSIDDFGTGYSSLSYLNSLPFDCLKIDKSFILYIFQSDASQGVVRSAFSMGLNLGLEVIAEGVETEEQFNFLIESGCEYFQGYLFSRPLPLAEFTALLTSAQQ
jgi:EAL domain-containing protein (putative c-di-GMP-specific phosphodiesterase class I)